MKFKLEQVEQLAVRTTDAPAFKAIVLDLVAEVRRLRAVVRGAVVTNEEAEAAQSLLSNQPGGDDGK